MLSLWLAAMVAGATGAEQKLILYFDPDGNHKAIAEITKLFNQYLAREKVPLTFQAVGHFEELQKQLRSGKAELAIVHSDFLRATQGLTPLLVPAWKGEPFYTKVLIDSGRGEPKRLAGSIIYATKSHGDRRLAEIAVLAMLRRANVDVAGARVVFVSKDIDGVLGVVFSQAQAALVTRENIEIAKAGNASATSLRQLYETPRILRPPLCIVGARKKEVEQRLIAVFDKMARDPVGRDAMLRMGFNGWVRFRPEMRTTP